LNETAGIRLRRFVDERMAAREVASIIELADTADVGRDTLYAWFRGRNAPTPDPGGKVARVLGVSYRDLLDVYEGNEEAPPDRSQTGLISALEAQTTAINELVVLLRPLAEAQAAQVADLQRAVQRLYELVTPAGSGPRVPRPLVE
jgi:transcriptional regulator with XRE-family HTH domain